MLTEPASNPHLRLPDLQGEHYLQFLERLHSTLQPKTYLEIGSRAGDSLAASRCASIAIDPEFDLRQSFFGAKPMCAFYRTTSDDFFSRVDPKQILGGAIDLAFLDGLHLAEYLLRDFSNTERHCKRNSVIAMHDCIPPEAAVARRAEHDMLAAAGSGHPDWWTGDVWKVILILKQFRPNLRIHPVDASPTGLVLITNLEPDSRVLTDHYFDILEEFRTMDLDVRIYVDRLQLISTQHLSSHEDISQYFWL